MLRLSLAEAKKTTSGAAIGAARYILANQYLCYGDPSQALAEAQPVPSGVGHSQCLLHSVAAQALWKLSRARRERLSSYGMEQALRVPQPPTGPGCASASAWLGSP